MDDYVASTGKPADVDGETFEERYERLLNMIDEWEWYVTDVCARVCVRVCVCACGLKTVDGCCVQCPVHPPEIL